MSRKANNSNESWMNPLGVTCEMKFDIWNVIAYLITFFLFGLVFFGISSCNDYCEKHYKENEQKSKEYWERSLQESYYKCKFTPEERN